MSKKRFRPKKSEVDRLFSSNLKAKNILGWKPKFNKLSGFNLALRKTFAWFNQEENLKNYKIDLYNI